MTQPLKLLAALGAALLLSACGGGDGGADTAPSPSESPGAVPASATVSTEAFVGYAATLAVDDMAEPLDVSMVVPPTSETDEPIEVR